MRVKINKRFVEIALFSILVTTIVMTTLFYRQLKKQVFSDLADAAELLTESGSYELSAGNLRITLVEPDGTVFYDSAADAGKMENHLGRPEIAEALSEGTGRSVRRSSTLAESIFYYACHLENGQVLRVGKEVHSVRALLFSAFPAVIGMALLLTVVCLFVSRWVTAAIIRPIDEMVEDMDHIDEGRIYEELIPFTRKIRLQHEEILSAANIRQEFTANVSHELKTPLAAISGYAELMESGMCSEADVKHFSGEMRKSAARLLTLINDIIKLSQLDAGSEEKMLESVNMAQIAQQTVQMLSLGASGNRVTVSYMGDQEAFVRIGKELAQELAYNLIENAIRYNRPGGRVDVSVSSQQSKIVFSVKDTGIGIPREHQDRIFERFYRVDKSRSKELGGTGLGLAIVKHICSLTEGTIYLESDEGEGTLISVVWDGERLQE